MQNSVSCILSALTQINELDHKNNTQNHSSGLFSILCPGSLILAAGSIMQRVTCLT